MSSQRHVLLQQAHLENLEKAKHSTLETYLYRVTFDTDKRRRGFIEDPDSAFAAGNPEAPIQPPMELLHCGGTSQDREGSPYISCSVDLFWCLWKVITALLSPTANSARIFLIADGPEYKDIQSQVYHQHMWETFGSKDFVQEAIRRAKAATEVLVHKKIGRERIRGFLELNRQILEESEELAWILDLIRDHLLDTYSTVAAIAFNHSPVRPSILAEWCERNLECMKPLSHCIVMPLYNGLLTNYFRFISRGIPWEMKDDFYEYLLWREWIPAHEEMEYHIANHEDWLIERAIEEEEKRMWEKELYREWLAAQV
jgi:hypothetical protein